MKALITMIFIMSKKEKERCLPSLELVFGSLLLVVSFKTRGKVGFAVEVEVTTLLDKQHLE
jgi:hypothetical protein